MTQLLVEHGRQGRPGVAPACPSQALWHTDSTRAAACHALVCPLSFPSARLQARHRHARLLPVCVVDALVCVCVLLMHLWCVCVCC